MCIYLYLMKDAGVNALYVAPFNYIEAAMYFQDQPKLSAKYESNRTTVPLENGSDESRKQTSLEGIEYDVTVRGQRAHDTSTESGATSQTVPGCDTELRVDQRGRPIGAKKMKQQDSMEADMRQSSQSLFSFLN